MRSREGSNKPVLFPFALLLLFIGSLFPLSVIAIAELPPKGTY